MAHDDLLEGDPFVAESQHRRATPADRAGRELDQPRAVFVVAQLGVDRTFGDAERAHGPFRALGNRTLKAGRYGRWCQVDRLLEKRPVQRIRLIEDREYVQPA